LLSGAGVRAVAYGIRYLFVRVLAANLSGIFSTTLLLSIGESFIIDTDHWRRWMMLGVMWGMFVPPNAGRRMPIPALRAL
jgi:hypothetical protein